MRASSSGGYEYVVMYVFLQGFVLFFFFRHFHQVCRRSWRSSRQHPPISNIASSSNPPRAGAERGGRATGKKKQRNIVLLLLSPCPPGCLRSGSSIIRLSPMVPNHVHTSYYYYDDEWWIETERDFSALKTAEFVVRLTDEISRLRPRNTHIGLTNLGPTRGVDTQNRMISMWNLPLLLGRMGVGKVQQPNGETLPWRTA